MLILRYFFVFYERVKRFSQGREVVVDDEFFGRIVTARSERRVLKIYGKTNFWAFGWSPAWNIFSDSWNSTGPDLFKNIIIRKEIKRLGKEASIYTLEEPHISKNGKALTNKAKLKEMLIVSFSISREFAWLHWYLRLRSLILDNKEKS